MPGNWLGSTRAARLPRDWHARRAATYRRAGGRCQHSDPGSHCPTLAPLHKTPHAEAGHADHIVPDAGDDHTNLQWLCAPHHRAKTTLEGSAALPRERRPHEQHPGLT